MLPTYYAQPCPTCGRQLQVRVAYLGKSLECQHCHGRFVAADPANPAYSVPAGDSSLLLGRADELLAAIDALRRAAC